ncbi:MAG TPA: twin-arginine translocation signal domain-containing protein, partial [Candidatus Marinimicrobia bacterium]|nr:twin-arginine translocation signal domain-containing protein [Candidatus Neomarinimicrobiota bacterium]
MQTDKHSRRNFIKKTAVGAMGIATLSARSYDNILGANDRINIGIVGLNGRGQGHIRAVANIRNVTIRALCDVDSRVLTKSVETVNKWTG